MKNLHVIPLLLSELAHSDFYLVGNQWATDVTRLRV